MNIFTTQRISENLFLKSLFFRNCFLEKINLNNQYLLVDILEILQENYEFMIGYPPCVVDSVRTKKENILYLISKHLMDTDFY